jgi:2-polyprenyl-6-methoxyphenol hydroxylase-like FAD-dependent oxidoreductase
MYDVIVVGARCAGSPAAMLLAQRGYRVLLADRATFPSDTVSTHFVKPPGVAMLRRWGLLAQVAASGCPPVRRFRFDYGLVVLAGSPPPLDGGAESYAPAGRFWMPSWSRPPRGPARRCGPRSLWTGC